jgi:protein-L-isoaspartate(D-aspartate) O-methyltransferase
MRWSQGDFAAERERMVARQIAARGIADPRLLAAMRAVPREEFVPDHLRARAFDDSPLPIGAGQTISQPYIVALMIEAARLGPGDRVLEIGAGSGYAASVMAELAERVFAVERHAVLAERAAARVARLGYANLSILVGDGTEGLADEAPFDAILVAATGPDVPEVLLEQLAEGGRLVMPVGAAHGLQSLIRMTRLGPDRFERADLGGVRFVPLIGAHGFREE